MSMKWGNTITHLDLFQRLNVVLCAKCKAQGHMCLTNASCHHHQHYQQSLH